MEQVPASDGSAYQGYALTPKGRDLFPVIVAIQQSQNNENEGTAQRLAARQARLLKRLTSANSPLQQRINDVLDPQQRKKLDSFKRTSQVTVVDGN